MNLSCCVCALIVTWHFVRSEILCKVSIMSNAGFSDKSSAYIFSLSGYRHYYEILFFPGSLLYEEDIRHSGGYSVGVPPLPIPNREVKPDRADGTAQVGE